MIYVSDDIFWGLTIKEMLDIIRSRQRELANNSYITAQLTASFIGVGMTKGATVPTFDEIFPELMSEEQIEHKHKQEVAIQLAKWKAFMESNNKRRHNEV